jgi:hypothetical protein
MPGAPASDAKGGSVTAGSTANNQMPPPGDLQLSPAAQADSRGSLVDQDANSAAQKYEREPWFAKLPPSLRSAIQSKTRVKAPRGYEERLRRYFESVE